ncbi:hypothetical protein M422DRAFT_274658 [Sphaerobolus stellatus SS14]|uniref:Uncharacterized protein n=1 Tax=Sphaerobolus stellatus (strain SS14) TaxID=990650 RepID=A0A0C9T6I2_SPHS4|nr:hypothetical protein M422DRAFT_274658 [Sphaerobolus stellatus SS14]
MELEKKIRQFFWDSPKSSPIAAEYLSDPLTSGGRKLLNLKARNKAIELMKLKSYLNFGPDRPRWALLADDILRKNVNENELIYHHDILVNPFVQNWPVLSSKLPDTLKRMVSAAETAGLLLDGLEINHEVKMEMTIWFHPAITAKHLWNSKWMNCLKWKHKIYTNSTQAVGAADVEHACQRKRMDAPPQWTAGRQQWSY